MSAAALASLSWGYSVLNNYTPVTSTASAFPKIKGIYFKARSRNTFSFRDCSAEQQKKKLIIQLVCKETHKGPLPQQQSTEQG